MIETTTIPALLRAGVASGPDAPFLLSDDPLYHQQPAGRAGSRPNGKKVCAEPW